MSVELLGYNVDDYSFEEAIIKAKSLIDGDKVSQVVTINPEMFQEAEKNANFSNIIKEAEMVIPDGIGVKIALQITGKKANRIPGIDFAKKLLQEAATSGIPVASESPFAKFTPTSNAPISPGAYVTPIASMSESLQSASSRACLTTGTIASA